MSEELEACPCCKAQALAMHAIVRYGAEIVRWIECSECYITTQPVWDRDWEKLVRAWNTRPGEGEK